MILRGGFIGVMAMDGKVKVPKFKVYLAADQRERLLDLVRNGHASAKKMAHARVLLLSDEDHPDGGREDAFIARTLGLHRNTISRIRGSFVRGGETPALERKVRLTPPRPAKLDGHAEAHLISIACSTPPDGRSRWTLNLLARELVGRKIVTSICVETVRQSLKKVNCSPGKPSDSASRRPMAHTSSPGWNKSSISTHRRRTRTSR